MMDEIIKVKNLNKEFKVPVKDEEGFLGSIKHFVNRKYINVTAIKDVSMNVKCGEIMALIGPNGSGKSTTIKVLTGVLYPSYGEVEVNGFIPWKDRKKYVNEIGIVTGQRSQLIWDLPAVDTFDFNREVYKIKKNDYINRVKTYSKLLDVEEIIKRPVRLLSLGERMKCEILCSLIHDPKIIFLDEPTIGIDLNSKKIIHEFIKTINFKRNKTFILTTHNLDDVENLCEKVTVINKGTVVYSDRIENIKNMVSDKRIVKIKCENHINKELLNGYDLVEIRDKTAKIKINTKNQNIQEFIMNIVSKIPCLDIIIEGMRIEDVISEIYSWEKLKVTYEI